MKEVYRLVKADRADEALSGDGARLYGGRWNPPGIPVVYASVSRALAVLEVFVHLTLEARSMSFALCTITLPARTRLRRFRLSRSPRTADASREAGRAWIESNDSVGLVVPSVIVPQEANYVLNVQHPHFARVEIRRREAFSFDERLWRRKDRRRKP